VVLNKVFVGVEGLSCSSFTCWKCWSWQQPPPHHTT